MGRERGTLGSARPGVGAWGATIFCKVQVPSILVGSCQLTTTHTEMYTYSMHKHANVVTITVPDLGSRSRVVVFVGAGCWGNLRRVLGIWNGEGMGRG
jgi:hypothetical protein